MDAGDPVTELLKRGEHAQAAHLCEQRGELRRAIQIYERLWRFAQALPLALDLRDEPLAARLALDAGDLPRAVAIASGLPTEHADALHRTADAFASRGHPFEAARLRERAGDFTRAACDYMAAGALLDAARAQELAGDTHAADQTYQRICRGDGAEVEIPHAELALGRLLARMGKHEDAARHLQRAARHEGVRVAALGALCVELQELGLRTAAVEALRRARRLAPELPTTPEQLAEQHRIAPGDAGSTLLRGRFKVQRSLGGGASGRVLQAEDVLLGRPVAVKLLSVGAGGSGAERTAYQRFLREVQAASRLSHPNIVTIYDVDETQGLLVMELMEGTLADRLAPGRPLAPAQVRRLALDVLAALELAHARGIIHRDLKPANVFFDHAGNAKLGDFGAAHLLDFGQTQTGGFVGTVAYMSPEQISDAAISPATDFYALGVTLFEALTGRHPFSGPDLVAQHLGEAAPPVTELVGGLTPAHDETLRRALAKAPAERFASALEMTASVRSWPAGTSDGFIPAAAQVAGAAPPAPPEAARPMLPPTKAGLHVRRDPRVDRDVLVEERVHPMDEAALQHVRRLAAAGGPHVQRVLGISDDLKTITYEALPGPTVAVSALATTERELLAGAYSDLQAAGLTERQYPTQAVRTEYGPVLLVAIPDAS